MTESFAELLEESFGGKDRPEGSVLKGTIVRLDSDFALIDVGLKSEGRVAIREFDIPGQETNLNIGDTVDVFVERLENIDGEVVLSRDKAKREEAWKILEEKHEANERIEGIIFNRVKGGFTVDLQGAIAFLPGSQVDLRPIRDMAPLMNVPMPLQILKMDRQRSNIVVSRRAVLEETRAEQRSEVINNLSEGQIVEGTVKNITDYGAFIDLGGVDGLLHVTDISWKRINHPSAVLTVGQEVKVQVIRFNSETQRVSLGMKQLETDPWESVEITYAAGTRHTGSVTNITDYGAFVELVEGIEGLVHVSEMSWVKKNIHPSKIVSPSQEVEVQVLEVDASKRRISLGIKQCTPNPWDGFADKFPIGAEIEGEVKNVTEFGLFVGLTEEIDGMVHMSDISWELSNEEALGQYSKGNMVKAKILDVDIGKERISLGIKQLTQNPKGTSSGGKVDAKKGEVVTCTVTDIEDGGIAVTIKDGIIGYVKRAELSRERSEQRSDRFAKDEKFDAKIVTVGRNGQVNLSIKALEAEQEKEAMEQFGSEDSGASLGDILGKALKQAQKDK